MVSWGRLIKIVVWEGDRGYECGKIDGMDGVQGVWVWVNGFGCGSLKRVSVYALKRCLSARWGVWSVWSEQCGKIEKDCCVSEGTRL